ncbi:helix-turn-helix domain-containing protein [Streptomyces lasiicapitis]|uniref:helix-turn-helix domain-containing protein n=1 Tax=Streptomyces lasiicapitis TaxID=1923961 RepID=UPI003321847C
MEPQELQEYRYRAVREVLEVSPIGEVAARYGTSRQSLHSRRRRFEQEGMAGPRDRSRRPRTSPSRISADIEALVCRLRRQHPRWGARRIRFEMTKGGAAPVPSRATVHRVLVRNGMVTPAMPSLPTECRLAPTSWIPSRTSPVRRARPPGSGVRAAALGRPLRKLVAL